MAQILQGHWAQLTGILVLQKTIGHQEIKYSCPVIIFS